MRGKSLALLVLALGCGLVASLGITQVMAKRGDSTQQVDTVPVLIAVKDIPVNGIITKDTVKTEQWPKEKVQPGAVVRLEDVEGRRSRQKVFAGEQIVEPKLMAKGEVATGDLIPKGMRVVSIRVDPVAIHGGLLLPGARVDMQLYVAANPGAGINETTTTTILQDIRVFAVNDVTNLESADPKAPETKSIQGKTVSLVVTPSQAETVTLASETGSIRLIMRHPEDTEHIKASSGQVLRGLLGGRDVGRRTEEDPEAKRRADGFAKQLELLKESLRKIAERKEGAAPHRSEEPTRWPMKVIVGSSINDVVLMGNGVAMGPENGTWSSQGQINYPPSNSKPSDNPNKALGTGNDTSGPGQSQKSGGDLKSLLLKANRPGA